MWGEKINIKNPNERSKYLNAGQDLQVTSDNKSMTIRYIFLTYPEILYVLKSGNGISKGFIFIIAC